MTLKYSTNPFLYLLCMVLLTALLGIPSQALTRSQPNLSAERLYEKYQDSVYQIRVMELASGNKTAIGSGFLISDQGHVATNYHVVSQWVLHPKRYRLELIKQNGETLDLSVLAIDVVHDLAIAKTNPLDALPFSFGSAQMPKGAKLYALGNPHDLGMSVVEGTYNGLLEKAFYDKIFFSGSLNPGMSGGPALNAGGEVVGINVSTAGNQLSFLVPVHYLRALKHQAKNVSADEEKDFIGHIQDQLLENQDRIVNGLLDEPWPKRQFAELSLPGKLSEVFKCWGDTDETAEAFLNHSYSHCMSEDKIFLANYLTTGGIAYSYDYYGSAKISSVHFYNLYSKQFGRTMQVNSARKEDVTNYACHNGFTATAEKGWKAVICARSYRKYPKLWDVSLDMASVDQSNSGVVLQLVLAGVSKENALRFIKRFTEEVK
jgi:S1-C subfamily serine protease